MPCCSNPTFRTLSPDLESERLSFSQQCPCGANSTRGPQPSVYYSKCGTAELQCRPHEASGAQWARALEQALPVGAQPCREQMPSSVPLPSSATTWPGPGRAEPQGRWLSKAELHPEKLPAAQRMLPGNGSGRLGSNWGPRLKPGSSISQPTALSQAPHTLPPFSPDSAEGSGVTSFILLTYVD